MQVRMISPGILSMLIVMSLLLTGAAQAGQIHQAVSIDDINLVRQILARNPGAVNERDEDNFTPLHTAAATGSADMVMLLIRSGADVNARGEVGRRPLHYASNWGYTKIIAILIKSGADVNARDNSGATPLFYASNRTNKNKQETARILVQSGASTTVKDGNGNTPLMYAKNNGAAELAQILASAGSSGTTAGAEPPPTGEDVLPVAGGNPVTASGGQKMAYLNGSQVSRGAGTTGQLICKGLALSKGGVITSVNCGSAGFWITDDKGSHWNYNDPQKAVNVLLQPGTYWAYPNLGPTQKSAGLTIGIRETP